MPLSIDNYGTNASGTNNLEYCKFCFQKGGFTDTELTLPQMIQMSVTNMTKDLHMSDEEAQNLANTVIPTLKRWRVHLV